MGREALLAMMLGVSACPARDAASTSTSTSPSASAETGTRPSAPPRPAAAPAKLSVELRGVVEAQGIGLSVRALEEVELAASVQWVADGAQPVPALTLRLDCRAQGCVKLVPGAELLAPTWLERPEAERCDALFRPAQPGTYRLRVQSCDGARQAETLVRWAEP